MRPPHVRSKLVFCCARSMLAAGLRRCWPCGRRTALRSARATCEPPGLHALASAPSCPHNVAVRGMGSQPFYALLLCCRHVLSQCAHLSSLSPSLLPCYAMPSALPRRPAAGSLSWRSSRSRGSRWAPLPDEPDCWQAEAEKKFAAVSIAGADGARGRANTDGGVLVASLAHALPFSRRRRLECRS